MIPLVTGGKGTNGTPRQCTKRGLDYWTPRGTKRRGRIPVLLSESVPSSTLSPEKLMVLLFRCGGPLCRRTAIPLSSCSVSLYDGTRVPLFGMRLFPLSGGGVVNKEISLTGFNSTRNQRRDRQIRMHSTFLSTCPTRPTMNLHPT